MRLALLLTLALVAGCQRAPEWSHADDIATDLIIQGTLNVSAFRPLVAEFTRRHPNIRVRYEKVNGAPLYAHYLEGKASGQGRGDLLVSSAMDLQVKLANDGYALTHHSPVTDALPAWAKWRNQVFAVTLEPAVMVFNKTLMRGRAIPRSRPELLDALNAEPSFWKSRVVTYDIRTSSVGYFLASRDAREGFVFGSLVQAFRNVGLKVSDDTTAMFDDIERGRAVMGYNLLGSYAWRRQLAGAPIVIVYPRDYTLAVSRVALIPADAPHADAAHLFLDFLLSRDGQRILVAKSRLSAVRTDVGTPPEEPDLTGSGSGPIRPVPLGPGLLTYLDRQKHDRLVETWSRATDVVPDLRRGVDTRAK